MREHGVGLRVDPRSVMITLYVIEMREVEETKDEDHEAAREGSEDDEDKHQ